jgi:plasmid rolling circle replication initiator protein Rep
MTILVGLTPEFFRCITCGADLQQHINGKISYIPTLTPKTLKSNLDKYFDGEKV